MTDTPTRPAAATPQTDAPEPGRWCLTATPPAEALRRLPHMGKVMGVLRHRGATHERIGTVTDVTVTSDQAILNGPVHTARIDLDAVADVTLDTATIMQGKVFPVLDFRDAAGEVVFSVVGMDGATPFVTAFAQEDRSPIAPRERRMPAMSATPETMEDDPGFALLDRLCAEGADLRIILHPRGRRQSWTGRIAEVRPAMGFANVMTEDFHLHLKAGAVHHWDETEAGFVALDKDGRETGLVIEQLTERPA
ncbi:hemin-degrading factor [Pseudooceanicola aestuarii]|uniref:hemin-degrading factor n=1 Tax=Pseudooceanicola aestuarii TaxID=2697319 RepID=UPI0013D19EB8|nr:hemin-degrading factor [Pseudooceanicola aestuarii]